MLPYGIACSNRLMRCAEVVPQGTFSCPNRQFTLSHPAVEHSSLDKTCRCRPQPPDERVAQHCYPPGKLLLPFGQFTLCCACAEQPICVAVRYLTLRIGGYTARKARPCGRKNPLPFPCFAAVAVLRFSPCPPRETGVKRVETAGVYPLAPPAWVRRPRRAAKCFGTETLLVLTSSGQERKI